MFKKIVATCVALCALSTAAFAGKVFVSGQEAKDLLAQDKTYQVFEVSWGTEKDSPDYLTGHIPGAVHFNTDHVEEGPLWNLLPFDRMVENFKAMGVTKDSKILAYGHNVGVTRVVFAMLWAGVQEVKIIDGGLEAWKAAGGELETTSNAPQPVADFGLTEPAHPEYVLSLAQVKEKLDTDKDFQLVSIRAKAEYDGETSGYTYIPKAGEPKGAIWGHAGSDSLHMEDYLHDDGTYINIDELRALWADRNISTEKEISLYCGTGWRACIPWLILYENGIESTLFDGGWNEWQMNDDLPVQLGDPAQGDVQIVTVGDLSPDKAVKN